MISVCIATYNGEKYVKDQIDSILKQLSIGDEIIISDDHSSDKTVELIANFRDPRIKIYYNSGPNGYTSNFYNALSKATGDYIFLSDQDDVWLPNKVAITLGYLEKYDYVHSDCIITDENLTIVDESRNKSFKVKGGYLNNLLRTRALGCCMAFKSCVLKALFPVPCYSNDVPHDLWVELIAWRYFKSTIIPEKLLYYRRHSGTSSNGGAKSTNSLVNRIKSRLKYIYYVARQRKTVRGIK